VTKIAMPPEATLQAQADALAADMVKTLNGILRRAANALGETITAASSRPEDAVLRQAEQSWLDAVSGDFFPRVVNAYVTSAETVHLSLIDTYGGPSADVPFVMNSTAVAYLTDTANRMVDVTEGTWARARAQLIEGFRAGESVQQLATRLHDVAGWSESRAETVARTEIIAASNAGALAEIQATGAVAKKTWLATMDSRTREAHRLADGQSVSVNNMFLVDGEYLDFPGDPQGEPGNTINCRCAMQFEIKKGELQVALNDLEDVTDEFDPADFVDLESLLAAGARQQFAPRKPFDEAKHKRGRGGKFAPKSGGGGKIDYRKPPKKKSAESAPKKKIDYTKPAKKAAPPAPAPAPTPPAPAPVAKKVAPAPPPPPPAKKTAAPAKKTAKKIAPPAPSPEPDDDLLAEPVTPTPPAAAPEPNSPVVDVTEDVLENIATSDGGYAGPGERVVVGNRAGTVRTAAVNPATGLSQTLGIQFDDSPTELTEVDAGDALVVDEAEPGYEPILNEPFDSDVLSEPLPDNPVDMGGGGEDEDEEFGPPPLSVTPGFETPTPSEMLELQDDMLTDEPWTVGQEEALTTYSGDGYSDMNGCLRFDEGCSDDVEFDNDQAVAAMRPLPRGVTTFRGANLRALGVMNHQALAGMVGNTVRDPGFTSSSISPDVATSFGQGSSSTERVIMQIESPAGTPAAYVDGISQNSGEFEMVLPPNTRYEILEVISPTADGGPSTVRLRVVS
jgi:SPP1 gp7 family putative phage head morphogenesis protein